MSPRLLKLTYLLPYISLISFDFLNVFVFENQVLKPHYFYLKNSLFTLGTLISPLGIIISPSNMSIKR